MLCWDSGVKSEMKERKGEDEGIVTRSERDAERERESERWIQGEDV